MSNAAEIGLVIVRRVLEEELSLELASKVLFEALTLLPDDQDIPRTRHALASFVAGPLASTLRDKHGDERTSEIVDVAMNALSSASIFPPPASAGGMREDTGEPSIDVEGADGELAADPFAQTRSTLKISTAAVRGDTLRLLIVSRRRRLSRWIVAAFGGERVTAITTAHIESCAENLRTLAPAIVIVDGQDAADIRPHDLVSLLASSDQGLLTIIWASDQHDRIVGHR